MNIKELLKKKKLVNYLLITFISLSLSACNEEKKATAVTPLLPASAATSESTPTPSSSGQNGLLSHLVSGAAGGVAAGAASAATSHAIQSFKDKRERKKGLLSANRFRQRRRSR